MSGWCDQHFPPPSHIPDLSCLLLLFSYCFLSSNLVQVLFKSLKIQWKSKESMPTPRQLLLVCDGKLISKLKTAAATTEPNETKTQDLRGSSKHNGGGYLILWPALQSTLRCPFVIKYPLSKSPSEASHLILSFP